MLGLDFTICILAGGVVGWLLKQWRSSAEIGKLKAEKTKLEQETVKYAGENLTKLQEKRATYGNDCENCKRIALKLCEELKNQVDTIANTREGLCTALYNKAIPHYVNLIEWEQLLSKDNPEKLKKLITEEVIAELRRFKEWIRVINHPKFINDRKLTPSKISKRTLSPFIQLLEDLSSKDKSTVGPLLKKAIDEVISEGLSIDSNYWGY